MSRDRRTEIAGQTRDGCAGGAGASARRSDRWLERALVASFVIHAVALVVMAALLAPMLPGGSGAIDSERVARLAAHPWQFRIGWLPWQLCAVSDVALAIAMIRVRWLPRVPVAFLEQPTRTPEGEEFPLFAHPGDASSGYLQDA